MKIILTAKTEKGDKSTERDIDKTVDELVKISNCFNKKQYKFIGPKFYKDGTSFVVKKCNTK